MGHRQAERIPIRPAGRHPHRLFRPVQTVSRETNVDYYDLIREFECLTGCAVLVNTSFNVRGEPIVCSPADAYRCFMRTHLDYLVLGPFLLDKVGQPEWKESGNWKQEFQLD